MAFDPILLAPRADAARRGGFWPDRNLLDDLAARLTETPDREALIAYRSESGRRESYTYRDLDRMARRLAGALARRGVGRGDVISAQLPNWPEFVLLYLASLHLGATLNPLMPIFRARELRFMLAHAESKVLVIPSRFRSFDYRAMIAEVRPDLPALAHVLAVESGAEDELGPLLTEEGETPSLAPLTPDEITQLIYTSGTTGEPKGVMHSSNTLYANILPYAARLGLDGSARILMASPMAHQTGFMYGLMMPIILGAPAILLDIWEPRRALDIIREERVSFTMASTPFLADLTRAARETGMPPETLRLFVCAGAPIPGPLVEEAQDVLGVRVISAWGMTENGAVTLTRPEDPPSRSAETDGCPLPGAEIKVVNAEGRPLPPGKEGRLLVRSVSNFGGYHKRPEWNATDAEGWFDTGDLARLDEAGYVRITGRAKDIIIRGGENIPVVEIEALLYRHPAIAQVAIVGYPDPRLGERACALVVFKEGARLTLADLTRHLEAHRVARPYWPERLEIIEAMPMTASGKIQKFRLRDWLRARGATPTNPTPSAEPPP
jgi:cyclohexanecarboxylate-CoA ligase